MVKRDDIEESIWVLNKMKEGLEKWIEEEIERKGSDCKE